jgi:malate dehydrogenase (oxaloacetate-decarboxylating)(NADP+)
MDLKKEALIYHSQGRKGKIEVIPTKPCATQHDLALAYTPGVAQPCLEIEKNPEDVFKYTAKGNLVAVVSNGTAVLGLGNIGAAAGKPVMEGKGVLFKRFADIDVFDIELNTLDPDEIIKAVQLMEPTFGGVNLEDIKAPECFYIEETLKKTAGIPIFHDDQHGTAIISGAALLNALELVNKKIDQAVVVINGAGAAGIACARLYVMLGVRRENIIMCDTKGVIYPGRTSGMNPYKELFANKTKARTLTEAMVGADVFCGVSVADCVSQEMVRSMAANPIIFAMANPDPEITYEAATGARPDVIMATGRSDFPNQVNNVLGFPFIFRGALDVRATTINDEMKIAASHALAKLAKEDVPDAVCKAYGVERIEFGPDYIIPKPLDERVLLWEAPAVAQAAMDTGVAQIKIDLNQYREQLEARLGKSREIIRQVINQTRKTSQKVVFPEGEHPQIIRAALLVVEEKIARPILLGRPEVIQQKINALHLKLNLSEIDVVNPATAPEKEKLAEKYAEILRPQKISLSDARKQLLNPAIFAQVMVASGTADAIVAGMASTYAENVELARTILQLQGDMQNLAGLHLLLFRDKILGFADTAFTIDPSAEDLAGFALLAAKTAAHFGIQSRVAMVSFSNYGSVEHPGAAKVKRAIQIVKTQAPDLVIDGELQAELAVNPHLLLARFSDSPLKEGANILIFPDLAAANIACQLLQQLSGAESIGPILLGLKHSMQLILPSSEVNDIVKMTAIAVLESKRK